MIYETKFLISLALTLIIEVPLVVLMVKYIIKLREVSLWKIIFVAFLASATTLPYLWFVIPPYVDARFYILYGEIFVVVTEAFIYNQLLKLNIIKALLLSITVNLISYYLGRLILGLF